MAKTFSEIARQKLLDLYTNHDEQVGRVLQKAFPDDYKDLTPTDCITYAVTVIGYAYQQLGNAAAAKHVVQLKKYGNKVSQYLVTKHHWIGVYINPDVKHPSDGNREHAYSNLLVNKSCTYYQIPISYRAVNYRPTAEDDPNFQKVNAKTPATPIEDVDLQALANVAFGFGISKGGTHTWLFSMGSVYEVHWDQIGTSLYEQTPLKAFPWLSGAIVVPPDQSNLLKMSVQKCRHR